jgi:tetratricopeptide (TPR) repeat protein
MSRKSKRNNLPRRQIRTTGNSPSAASHLQFWRSKLAICLMLAVVTFAVYLPVLQCQFVNYDDDVFVTSNPHLRNGLTRQAVEWSFAAGLIYSSPNVDYWRPLSYLSHALDIQLFGLHPAGHHLMSVAIHVAATLALFLVLNSMTGALWRSALVAAFFALHPLHVESVAWIAERKDVLSGLFFILTLGAYTGYCRNSSVSRYLLALGLFALALMSKPVAVTLPFVLLLLDYWPLRRFTGPSIADEGSRSNSPPSFQTKTALRLVFEKLPFFLLAMGLSIITFHSQKTIGATAALNNVTLPVRMENALVSYAAYILNLFWPVNLAAFYPYNITLPMWQVAGAFVLLTAITLLVLVAARHCPWLPVGWFWYLGMLLPAIGILQVGAQARADHYTYLSLIGLFLMVTWAVEKLCPSWPRRKLVLGFLMTGVLAILTVCTSTQISYWRNSETLWTHALACTSNNALAHNNLSNELLLKGNVDEAISHYQKALQTEPNSVETWHNLGSALLQKGRVDEAITCYQKVLQINPDNAKTHNNLGSALLQKGKVDEAITHFQKALQINPDYAEFHNNLGNAFCQKGRMDEAIVHFQKALQIKPDYAEACVNLGNALCQKGGVDEAITQFQKALQIQPDNAQAHNNLGSVLLQRGRLDEAIVHFQKALQIKPDYTKAYVNLGNALLQKGRVREAIAHFQKELQIQPDHIEVLNNLAWVLATGPQASLRNGNQAVELAQRANQITGAKNPNFLCTLAAAYAEAGRFSEAVETAQRALPLAEAQYNTALADDIRSELNLYQSGAPFHLPEPTPPK